MDNPVQEIIEERLLKLLGLESEFEMSYEEYIRHLREAMVAARMNKSTFSSEEAELITNEWKRVKNKDPNKRFTIKSKKTKTSNKPLKNNRALNFIRPKKQKLLAGKVETPPKEEESLLQIISDIRTTVDNIYNSLLNLVTITARNSELSRRRGESDRRQRREEGLESKIAKIGGMVSKVLTPIQGILDKIFRFITFTLLGKAIGAFFDWMENPENKKKFKSLMRFFSDHWPLFVGAFILFGTSFGSFVRGMLKIVAKGLIALAFNIPKIKKFLAKNPRLAMLGLGVATLGTGLIANTLNPPEAKSAGNDLKDVGKSDFDKSKQDAESASKIEIPTFKMGGNLLNYNPSSENQNIQNITQKIPSFANQNNLSKINLYANGGSKSSTPMKMFDGLVGNNGIPFSGGGKDNLLFPTANGGAVGLNGNEFIVNEGGVKIVGLPFLEAVNRIGGGSGANKPKMISSNNIKINGVSGGGNLNIRAFSGGGWTGNIFGNSKPTSTSTNTRGGGTSRSKKTRFPNIGRSSKAKQSSSPSVWHGPAPIPEHKTPEVKAFLKTVRHAEHLPSVKNPYNVIFGGAEVPITKMTVQEVINMQKTDMLPKRFGGGKAPFKKGGKWESVASGAYQFMPDALTDLIRLNVIKPSEIMTSDVQDKSAWSLASEKRGLTLENLKKGKLSRENLDKVAPEWASLPTLSGKSFYGQPVKDASILQKVYNDSLMQLKSNKISQQISQTELNNLNQIVARNELNPMVLGNQSRAVPPGLPVKGKMQMLPPLDLRSKTPKESDRVNPTGESNTHMMATTPHSEHSQIVRNQVKEILGVV